MKAVEVFKIKDKHYKKLFSTGEFYKRIGLIKFVKKTNLKFHVEDILYNSKTDNKLRTALYDTYKTYNVGVSKRDKVKLYKKKKKLTELGKYDKNMISMDLLNYAPKVDDEISDNEVWLITGKEK